MQTIQTCTQGRINAFLRENGKDIAECAIGFCIFAAALAVSYAYVSYRYL